MYNRSPLYAEEAKKEFLWLDMQFPPLLPH